MAEINDNRQSWESLKKGNSEALAAIYRRFDDDLLNYAFALSRDKDMAKDCVQELFLNLWAQRKNLTTPVSTKAYLIVSLRNIVISRLTAEKRRLGMHLLFNGEQNNAEADVLNSSITEEEEKSRNNWLYKNLGALTKRQQEVIHLRFIQELDYNQIAEITGLNYQGARNLLYKALQALRKQILVPALAYLLVS
ncbi:hypothetical protein DJ568_16135 [Mucilaginibacter hurinus]|uniref:Sigma-70 family RNA polymerase sigma factor n=1 Tax=Mucilaginibacter hurinus TaxID=2201324 RepID=A0A367GLN3_9SPHI|nr:sigma-70 family RNA polymerase sigma factor [Mucilaginibacter hurinus]RCH53766.1 hypothetical protein DJ568_16135 [Mucilaginibacter hurinus]